MPHNGQRSVYQAGRLRIPYEQGGIIMAKTHTGLDSLDSFLDIYRKTVPKIYYIMDGKDARRMRVHSKNKLEIEIICDFYNEQFGNNDKYDVRFYIVDSYTLPIGE
jgi:hypothetical protein